MSEFSSSSFLNETEALRHASDLVSRGEITSAIASLKQALNHHPHSEKIPKTLSDLCMRSGQVNAANEYNWMATKNSAPSPSNSTPELPNSEDLDYLEEQSIRMTEAEYSFEQPNVNCGKQPESKEPSKLKLSNSKNHKVVRKVHEVRAAESNDAPTSTNQDISQYSFKSTADNVSGNSNKREVLRLNTVNRAATLGHSDNVKVSYRNRERQNGTHISHHTNLRVSPNTEEAKVNQSDLYPQIDNSDSVSKEIPIDYSSQVIEENERKQSDLISTLRESESANVDDEVLDENEFDFVETFLDEEFADEDEDTARPTQESDFDDLAEAFLVDENEEKLYEFWDDEIGSSHDEDTDIDTALDNKLTSEERARLVAVECILDFDWDTSSLPFLVELFSSTGWSNSRKAVTREVNAGATVNELKLALAVKELWQDSSRYWITFSKASFSGESTGATYRQLSWKQALHIVRLFNGIPSTDEIYDFLEREFDLWYDNRILRLCFPAFLKYLFLYRLNNRNIIDTVNGFASPEESTGLEADWLSQHHSNAMMKLKALGVDLVANFSPKRYYASDLFTHEYMLELHTSSNKESKGDT